MLTSILYCWDYVWLLLTFFWGISNNFVIKLEIFPLHTTEVFSPNIQILFFPETEPWKFNLYFHLSKSKQLSMQLNFLIPGLKE